MNCHLSDGKIDHLCESPKSVEMFTGVEGGGGGWWSPTHLINESPVELSVPLFIFGLVPDNDDSSRASSSD